jgi:hypothetical protein
MSTEGRLRGSDGTIPRPDSLDRQASPRVVGPGRRERSYLERLSRLELTLADETRRAAGLARELAVSQGLERGCQKLLDRMEARAQAERGERASLEQREKRLILALGGLQRENQLLRERLALTERARPLLSASERPAGQVGGARRSPARGAGRPSRGWITRLFRPR